MCQGPMHAFLKAVPKCEHHMHLEGSLEPSLLFKLANENGIRLPADTDPAFASVDSLLERYKRFASLDDFLHYYFIGMSALKKQSDFEALAWEYFVRAKADGVIHAEVFMDPQAHAERGVEYSTVVNGFTAACKRAETELGITTELIVCFLRHLPVSNAETLYQKALPDLKSGRVSGIGLSSTEKGNPPKLFKSIYASAEAEGVRRTAHAGEEADVSYMRDALESLHIQRADHGIKLVDDLGLMAEYVTKKILVTMCPLSNVRLQCVTDVKELPIRAYLNNRVRFSINSDDPAYFGGYILDNYCAVQEAFDLDVEEWTSIIMASIHGSWCSEARKEEMFAIFADVLAEVSRPPPAE
jgi:adenosine deaminase